MSVAFALVGPLPPPIGGATVLFSQMVEALGGAGVSLQVVNTSRGTASPLRRALRIARDLWRLERSQLVLVGGSWPSILPLSFVVKCRTRRWQAPLVVRLFGGSYRKRLSRRSIRTLARLMFRGVERLELEGSDCVEAWQEVLPYADVRQSPNVRLKRSPGPREAPRTPPVVGFAGRLCEAKGVGVLCGVAQLWRDEWCFVAVGPEDDKGAGWPSRMMESGVRYEGELEPADMESWFASIDVLVVPTTTWPEGHPGVIIESFFAGVPIIATDVGGIRELVDAEIGQLVPPNEPLAIGYAIDRVFSSTTEYSRLSSNCVARSRSFSAGDWVISLVDATLKRFDSSEEN